MQPPTIYSESAVPQGARTASIERTVEWIDTDASGHQHNSSVMRWVEAAEAHLMLSIGLTDYFPVAPRVNQTINYQNKLWFGQAVTATVWVKRLGENSLTLAFTVRGHAFREYAETVAATGTFTTAHVPAGAAASAPWPDHYRLALRGSDATDTAAATKGQ